MTFYEFFFADAKAVLSKSPLSMEGNSKIKVTALITLIENGVPVRSHALVISGFASNTKPQDLALLFENKKVSGGRGELKGDIFIDSACNEAVIAYTDLSGLFPLCFIHITYYSI